MGGKFIFLPSVHYQNIFEREIISDPLAHFVKWPIAEIRQACLKRIKEWEIHEHLADWAEKVIVSLDESKSGYDRGELIKEVLSWYVFNSRHDEVSIRAIEYAIALSNKWKNGLRLEFISKIVAGKLKEDNIYLYDMLPSLKRFICSWLDPMIRNGKRDGYSNSDWFMSERAQRVILAAGDFSFLWKIDEIIMLLEEDCIRPWMHVPRDTRDMHLARLRTTRKYLLKAKKEHKAGVNV